MSGQALATQGGDTFLLPLSSHSLLPSSSFSSLSPYLLPPSLPLPFSLAGTSDAPRHPPEGIGLRRKRRGKRLRKTSENQGTSSSSAPRREVVGGKRLFFLSLLLFILALIFFLSFAKAPSSTSTGGLTLQSKISSNDLASFSIFFLIYLKNVIRHTL